MNERAELDQLRKLKRLAELEAKANTKVAQQEQPQNPVFNEPNDLQIYDPFGKNIDTGIDVSANMANGLAGAGKAFTDIGRRVGQATGFVSRTDIDKVKEQDAPLMNTKAGMAGNIAGNVAAFLPTAAIPGANTATGAGLVGTLVGGMQTTGTGDSTLKNMALGGVTGGATQYGLNKAAGALTNRLGRKSAEATASKIANMGRDDAVQSARQAGYVIPPTSANPTKKNAVLESLGGKLLTEQKASVKNQDITNSLAKRALGLGDDVHLNDELINGIKKTAGESYEALKSAGSFVSDKQFVKDLSSAGGGYKEFIKEFPELANKEVDNLLSAFNKPEMSASGLVEGVKKLRFDAGKNLRSMDPEKVTLGRVQKKIANSVEDLMERNLIQRDMVGVLDDFKKGRTMYAKASTIHEAMDETGNVSAKAIAKMMDKGKMMTGEMEQIAKFGSTFPKAAQDIKRSMLPGSPLDWALSGSVSAMTGNPGYMALLAARPATRSLMLSKPYQNAMLTKDYTVGSLMRAAPKVVGNEKTQAISRLLASGEVSK